MQKLEARIHPAGQFDPDSRYYGVLVPAIISFALSSVTLAEGSSQKANIYPVKYELDLPQPNSPTVPFPDPDLCGLSQDSRPTQAERRSGVSDTRFSDEYTLEVKSKTGREDQATYGF